METPNWSDNTSKKVRRASFTALLFGVLKLLLGVGAILVLNLRGVAAADSVFTVIVGAVLLGLGLRLRWKPETARSSLIALMVLTGVTFVLALLTQRPIKIGVDFLLLGFFVSAWRSLPARNATTEEAGRMKEKLDTEQTETVQDRSMHWKGGFVVLLMIGALAIWGLEQSDVMTRSGEASSLQYEGISLSPYEEYAAMLDTVQVSSLSTISQSAKERVLTDSFEVVLLEALETMRENPGRYDEEDKRAILRVARIAQLLYRRGEAQ